MSSRRRFVKILYRLVPPTLLVAAALGVGALLAPDHTPPTRATQDAATHALHLMPGSDSSNAHYFPSMGAVLAPAPRGTRVQVSAVEARAAVAADGMRPDVQAAITPQVTLKHFTNTVLGQPASPPFGRPKYVRVVVWDVDFPDARVELHPPIGVAAPDLPPCDLHVIVDATTAEIIEGFQDCSR